MTRTSQHDVAGDAPPGEVPSGCWIREHDGTVVIGAPCFSRPLLFFAIGAAVFNVFVWFFFLQTLVEYYTTTRGVPPRGLGWLGQSTASATSSDFSAFMCVFLIPVIGLGAIKLWIAAVGIFGKVEVTLRGGDAVAFTGIGTVGRTRQFAASSVRDVRIDNAMMEIVEQLGRVIEIRASDDVRFGMLLRDDRRAWLAGELRMRLVPRK